MRYIILLITMSFLILSKYCKRYRKLFAFLSGLVLIVFASVRGFAFNGEYAGNDYFSYKNWFNSVENIKISWDNDILFNLLMLVIKNITGSFEIFIAICSIFFVYSIYSFSIKNSRNYVITIFLFVTFGIYELGLSAVRQWMAGSIFLLAYKFIKNKKFWKYAISIIIASGFHNSAIVLLGVYPFINIKIKTKYKIFISIITAVFFTITIRNNTLFNLIYQYFPTYKTKYLNIGKELNANYTVFIISSFCLFMIMFCKKGFIRKNIESIIYLDYLILLCMFSYTATLNPMFGRFLQYFMPAIPLIIPNILELFPQKQKLFAVEVCTVFFSIIYIL